jgi:acetyl esterase/lipase
MLLTIGQYCTIAIRSDQLGILTLIICIILRLLSAMKPIHRLTVILLPIALLAACGGTPATKSKSPQSNASSAVPASQPSFAKARKSFRTQLQRQESSANPVPNPPAAIARKVKFAAPAGQLSAYITHPPKPAKPGQKSPAIVWLSGGFCNCIDGDFWKPAPRTNDQTASAFRKAGIITMYPARRGGNEKVGIKEGFYGEVDDVIAAVDFLAKQPGVDPTRIYLGGHSTGGTLALLVAAAAGKQRLRSVFAFGPVADIAGYGDELPFNRRNRLERRMRSPQVWLNAIAVPTFVIEGTREGNHTDLKTLSQQATQPYIRFYPITGADHFTVLAPINDYIAQKIRADNGPTSNIELSPAALNQAFARHRQPPIGDRPAKPLSPKAQFRRVIVAQQ